MSVRICIALDLSVSGFGPSGVGCGRLEVSLSKNGYQTIANAIQHKDSATSSTLLK